MQLFYTTVCGPLWSYLLRRCDIPCAKERGSGGVELNPTLHIDWIWMFISTQKRGRMRENNRTKITVLAVRYHNVLNYSTALMGYVLIINKR